MMIMMMMMVVMMMIGKNTFFMNYILFQRISDILVRN